MKRWQDRFGNLLLQEFPPFTLEIRLKNEDTPEAGMYSSVT